MKTSMRLLLTEQQQHRKLLNAYLDGEYQLERPIVFFAQRDESDCLLGEQKTIGSEIICQPLRWTGQALLVCVTDKNDNWYAWVHS